MNGGQPAPRSCDLVEGTDENFLDFRARARTLLQPTSYDRRRPDYIARAPDRETRIDGRRSGPHRDGGGGASVGGPVGGTGHDAWRRAHRDVPVLWEHHRTGPQRPRRRWIVLPVVQGCTGDRQAARGTRGACRRSGTTAAAIAKGCSSRRGRNNRTGSADIRYPTAVAPRRGRVIGGPAIFPNRFVVPLDARP